MRPLYTPLVIAGLLSASAAAVAHPTEPAGRPTSAATPTPQETSSLQGTVQQWLLNPNGDVDGFLLANGQVLTQVAFAPHLSAALLQAAAIGDEVQISGWRALGLPLFSASRVTSMRSGRSVVDASPAELGARPAADPAAPGALRAMETRGQIARLLYNRRGDTHGVLLESGDIVRFAPHQAAQVRAELRVGQPLVARGWGLRNDYGQSIEATAIGPAAEAMQELFAAPGNPPQRHGDHHERPHGPPPLTIPSKPEA